MGYHAADMTQSMEAIEEKIRQRFGQASDLIRQASDQLTGAIAAAAAMVIDCYAADGAVFTFGNGGSASDAQHIACELVGRFLIDRPPLRAEALATDTATITSIANDYGYDAIFARQLAGKARPGDVAIGLSTSGNSPNVVAALKTARDMGVKTIAITGTGGGKCADLADVLLAIPSSDTPRIQETSAVIYHILCELIEQQTASE